MFPLIRITPEPVLLELGPIQIGWYGIGYVIALAVLLWLTQGEVVRRGIHRSHVFSAFLLVFVLALAGGRLYHVIDQWDYYRNNLIYAILPINPAGGIGFAGLGVYGGIAGAAAGILLYARWKRLPLRLALDSVIPGTLFAQGIARWGNFFNQELYGPPTDLAWGIAIECQYRVAAYPCSLYPFESTGFHPLFFYESSLTIAGGLIALFVSRRFLHRLQPGDLAAFWGIWYGLVRTGLEFLREDYNWQVAGIPTAQIVGVVVALVGAGWIAWNHRPGNPPYDYPPPAVEPEPEPEPDPFADDDEFDDELEEDDFDEGEADDHQREDEAATRERDPASEKSSI